ncbi:hypothetical protein BV22DRAFT_766357 [Leucogyrophana mollusca]|uniref:Uncharacterized protein n=1 Tax=Leucogyrophana mollusca TaxID=85980 RepID=A0ACB8B590_9AGAM|nr:hypothetical protein BV22DRAFT_766357 [Leucogyrophana mollusca]
MMTKHPRRLLLFAFVSMVPLVDICLVNASNALDILCSGFTVIVTVEGQEVSIPVCTALLSLRKLSIAQTLCPALFITPIWLHGFLNLHSDSAVPGYPSHECPARSQTRSRFPLYLRRWPLKGNTQAKGLPERGSS